jgi:hypothetical protein
VAKRFHEHRNPLFLAPPPNARQHTPKDLGKSGGDPIGGSENLHRSFPLAFGGLSLCGMPPRRSEPFHTGSLAMFRSPVDSGGMSL